MTSNREKQIITEENVSLEKIKEEEDSQTEMSENKSYSGEKIFSQRMTEDKNIFKRQFRISKSREGKKITFLRIDF